MSKIARRSINNDEDEQIEQTLHFFDSILDQYLSESDDKSIREVSSASLSSSSSSSVSSHRKPPPAPISSSKIRQSFLPPSQVRRFTSENNLNQIPPSSATKRKLSQSKTLQTIATSTEDLTKISARRVQQLSSNGASASLIDLSSIDQSSTRPRFRFVPQINSNHTLKEEPETEQPFHIKVIPSNDKLIRLSSKPPVTIVKPTVIIPTAPKTIPFNRPTESHIHHPHHGPSAFKPTNSNKKQQPIPHFHQSMLNLSTPDAPIDKRVLKVNNILVHPNNHRNHPSYLPTNTISKLSLDLIFFYYVSLQDQRPQTHYNQPKYNSPGLLRNAVSSHPSDIYNFNQPRRHNHRQSTSITTYL